ncbi:hypothetical protein [Mangrovimonas sp. DI 80]|uniref:hypothetical protein n=1 Tax=Mangrovimonas sp. DI 80 TaxID=1779330 RepID=UPI0009775485|nr:hypothetical protein [Mangrovimonas sp. DI 80]OMP32587.1 hypothetical protein BKM32_05965 [Mangrovimonas sp. DI 80]
MTPIKMTCKTSEHDKKNSLQTKSSAIPLNTPHVTDTTILVDYISKFENHNDYHLPLSLTSEYTDELWEQLYKASTGIAYQGDLETIYEMPDSIINVHFSTTGIDRLLLINAQQDVFDTIYKKKYKFYDASIESYYVASYEIKEEQNDAIIAISTNKDLTGLLNKSPETITKDSTEMSYKSLINKTYNTIFSESTLIHNKDTISVVSSGSYPKSTYSVFLIQNGMIKDSLTTEYLAIEEMKPIPLATDKELTYIYSGFQPDTDWYWNGLLAIDIKNWKLKTFTKNRINR